MNTFLRKRSDLGVQLFALFMLLIVPLLITLVVFDFLVGKKIQNDVRLSDQTLARSIAQENEIFIASALQVVSGIAQRQEVITMDIPNMSAAFQIVYDTQPNVNLIYRLDPSGMMIFHYPIGPESTVGNDFSFREYFQKALITHQPFVSKGRISPTTNQPVATAIMPIWSAEGEFLGLVGANIKLESITNIVETISRQHPTEEGFELLIVDADDQIIAHPDRSLLLTLASDLLPTAIADFSDQNSFSEIFGSGGVEKLYTKAVIDPIGWSIYIDRPASVAYKTQIILRSVIWVAAIAILLTGLLYWYFLNNKVIQPIEKLSPLSEAIGMNKPVRNEDRQLLIKESHRSDQIGNLIRAIFQMETSIYDRLREKQTLLETSSAVLSNLDLRIVLEKILEQMGLLLDIRMYAIIALDRHSGIFRIQASRGLSRTFTERLTIMPNEPDSVTMRALNAKIPIQVSDTEVDPTYMIRKFRARAEGYRSILAVPLATKHSPPTALVVFDPEPRVYSENEIELLVNFGNHAAMAVENATLFERSDTSLREQTNRLESTIQSLQDGLILSDLADSVIYVNRNISYVCASDQENLLRTSMRQMILDIFSRSEDKANLLSRVDDVVNGLDVSDIEFSILIDQDKKYFRLVPFAVTDKNDNKIGKGILLRDTTSAKELDRIRASLLSAVSHEIRTPLASIKGFASTLLADDVEWDLEHQRSFLTIISEESDRLEKLVNNILDFSRIDAKRIHLELQKCDIDEILTDAWARVEHGACRLDCMLPNTRREMYADPIRLQTIFRNLFENSIKYGQRDTTITVGLVEGIEQFVFTVQDNGPGIPRELHQKVFESFYRVDDSLTSQRSGVGLGLAICQGLVRAHGGRIWVEPIIGGTTIKFTLPIINAEGEA